MLVWVNEILQELRLFLANGAPTTRVDEVFRANRDGRDRVGGGQPPVAGPRVRALARRAVGVEGGAEEWHFECRIRRADGGAERWIEARGRPVRDEGGRPVRLLGVVADLFGLVAAFYASGAAVGVGLVVIGWIWFRAPAAALRGADGPALVRRRAPR